ncbi:hypothetical protein QBC37DRAFT_488139 [Rhypophila decipiens]|uniref:Uncharacterized protein n=1 Tax=Rhypophila decipiens TaxID=261697 RepID=A0AAN6XTP9_9PEZI|nr:hypothetical protein QBC37DRAFT_488139 [Rhypophila decipiens]
MYSSARRKPTLPTPSSGDLRGGEMGTDQIDDGVRGERDVFKTCRRLVYPHPVNTVNVNLSHRRHQITAGPTIMFLWSHKHFLLHVFDFESPDPSTGHVRCENPCLSWFIQGSALSVQKIAFFLTRALITVSHTRFTIPVRGATLQLQGASSSPSRISCCAQTWGCAWVMREDQPSSPPAIFSHKSSYKPNASATSIAGISWY